MKKEKTIYKLYFKYTNDVVLGEAEYYSAFYSLEDIPNNKDIKEYIEKEFDNIVFVRVDRLVKETITEEEIKFD